MRTFALPALLGASALVLTGCAATPPADADAGLSVVATTTQIADFTRNIVGDAGEVTQLIQPNQSAHDYDPSPADLSALAEADVLVINGLGLEEWLDDAVEASGFAGVTIDASEGIEAHEGEHAHAEDEHAAEEEHADELAAEEEHADEHAEEEHAEGEEAHEHPEGDPHIWTDPHNAEHMVENIVAGLAAEADDAEAIEANGDDYLAKLEALDTWAHENIDSVPADERLLVTNHDAFGYFIEAFGITYVGAVIPSFDDNAEVSATDIEELVAAIRETGAKAVFSEASLSPAAAETIAAEAGVEVYAGEDALYGDSLGPADSDGATYLASQAHNVTVLLDSWGAEATAPPAELSE